MITNVTCSGGKIVTPTFLEYSVYACAIGACTVVGFACPVRIPYMASVVFAITENAME